MPRALWKGAISFGLVYIPVQLHSASRSSELDLDLLDKHDFAPVGYQRINKRTGKVVKWDDIVKGYEYKKGEYVALSDEDFRRANVKASQTIDIQSFVDAADIDSRYYETPYFVAPTKGGGKVYALLREALLRTGKAAVATVVIRTRQHIAVLLPNERALVLNTLRFAHELRSEDELDLPAKSGKAAGLSSGELSMAEKLIEEMTGPWKPEQFRDTYRDDLLKRIEEKVRKHQTHELTAESKSRKTPGGGAEIIDLMEVLKRSLQKDGAKSTRRASNTRQRASKKANGSATSGRRTSTARAHTTH
jgi:DNA end-binding protein Ku